jgi:hypothetical protein
MEQSLATDPFDDVLPRRLAAKYHIPALMWKHSIHSFLELLRRRLPDSIDYILAVIYLAYQMMTLL